MNPKPFAAYVICATPRSGSTLLCDLLTGTKVAGQPDSFFRRESLPEWGQEFQLPIAGWDDFIAHRADYLAAVARYGRNNTERFGMRVMWQSMAEINQWLDVESDTATDVEAIASRFGTALYIHLSRRNKIHQAVSLFKAQHSGLWHIFANGDERERLNHAEMPHYDAEKIAALLKQLRADDANWQSWFQRRRIKPLRIHYETLATDPRSVLATILEKLGLDLAHAQQVVVQSGIMADATSAQWTAQFLADVQAAMVRID